MCCGVKIGNLSLLWSCPLVKIITIIKNILSFSCFVYIFTFLSSRYLCVYVSLVQQQRTKYLQHISAALRLAVAYFTSPAAGDSVFYQHSAARLLVLAHFNRSVVGGSIFNQITAGYSTLYQITSGCSSQQVDDALLKTMLEGVPVMIYAKYNMYMMEHPLMTPKREKKNRIFGG